MSSQLPSTDQIKKLTEWLNLLCDIKINKTTGVQQNIRVVTLQRFTQFVQRRKDLVK